MSQAPQQQKNRFQLSSAARRFQECFVNSLAETTGCSVTPAAKTGARTFNAKGK